MARLLVGVATAAGMILALPQSDPARAVDPALTVAGGVTPPGS